MNAYRNDGGFSVFLTGSNSYLLSGELATKLTGRYVETEMFTLGFSEHLGMKGFLGLELSSDAQEFEQWLSFGGFPRALRIADPAAKADYVHDVVGQVFEKDGKLECDFIVRKGDEYAYVQVAMTVADPEVERREYAPFDKIRDGWPRYLFTLDPLRNQRDGVRHLNLMEFLKKDGDLF